MTLSKAVRIHGDELEEIGWGKVVNLKVCCFAGLNLSSQCWRTGKEWLGGGLLGYLGSRVVNSVQEQLQDKSFPYILVGKLGRRHPLEQIASWRNIQKKAFDPRLCNQILSSPSCNVSHFVKTPGKLFLSWSCSGDGQIQYNMPTMCCPESNSDFRTACTVRCHHPTMWDNSVS